MAFTPSVIFDHCRLVSEVADHGLFGRLQVGNFHPVGNPDTARQRRQPTAQLRPEAAGRSGQQDRIVVRIGHAATWPGWSLTTAAPMRATASESITSDVAVEMRKKGDRP